MLDCNFYTELKAIASERKAPALSYIIGFISRLSEGNKPNAFSLRLCVSVLSFCFDFGDSLS